MVLGTNWGDLAALRSEFGVSGVPGRMHQPWDARVTVSAVKGHHREFRKFHQQQSCHSSEFWQTDSAQFQVGFIYSHGNQFPQNSLLSVSKLHNTVKNLFLFSNHISCTETSLLIRQKISPQKETWISEAWHTCWDLFLEAFLTLCSSFQPAAGLQLSPGLCNTSCARVLPASTQHSFPTFPRQKKSII